MRAKIDSERHEEFLRLMKEMEGFGLYPADVARQLNKTPGAISQYTSGYCNPSKTVLELLRRVVSETRDGNQARSHDELYRKLVTLQRKSPVDYEFISKNIDTFYERIPPAGRQQVQDTITSESSYRSKLRRERETGCSDKKHF